MPRFPLARPGEQLISFSCCNWLQVVDLRLIFGEFDSCHGSYVLFVKVCRTILGYPEGGRYNLYPRC